MKLSLKSRKAAFRCSVGDIKADLVITGGKLVNVYTKEIYAADIAVKGDRIARVGNVTDIIGSKTRMVNAQGRLLVPGLVDGHIHVDSSMLTITEFARVVLPLGTTAIIADLHETANALGFDGVKAYLKEARNLPLKLFYLVAYGIPFSKSLQDSAWDINTQRIKESMSWEVTVAAGDMHFPAVIRSNTEAMAAIQDALLLNKSIEGYAPTFYYDNDNMLQAYYVMGVRSETPETFDETLTKIRLGTRIFVREGLQRHLSKVIKLIVQKGLDTRFFMLVSDDKTPIDLLEKGHLDYLIRMAVKEGVDPLSAIQMATLNPAEHYRLDHEIGSINPGRIADILLIDDDLGSFRIRATIASGQLVATENMMRIGLTKQNYNSSFLRSIRLRRKVQPDDFEIRVHQTDKTLKANVIKITNEDSPTTFEQLTILNQNGKLIPDPAEDVIRIAIVERYLKQPGIGRGLLSGFGLREGAVASSSAHDHHNIVVAGTNTTDMSLAVNSLISLGGGHVFVKNNEIKKTVPLPYAGLFSLEAATKVKTELDSLENSIRSNGSSLNHPLIYLIFFVTPHVVPWCGISNRGIIDVRTHSIVPLIMQ
jgi:adenine deaminase